jgi:hypothetical protein
MARMMESELEAALRAVREVEESVTEQRQRVSYMERAGLMHAAAIASAQLEELESTLAIHLERLKRVGGLHC